MGISAYELLFLGEAFAKGLLPQGADILEVGEAELNGMPDLKTSIENFLLRIGRDNPALVGEAARLGAAKSDYQRRFTGARLFYRALFDYRAIMSVDGIPSRNAVCVDLNYECDLGRRFDVCINNGTAEHVFNIGAVFEILHRHTKTDGLMLHWMPCIGWLNHGLYNIQPCMLFDLAAANKYEVVFAALVTPTNFVELRSPGDANAASDRFHSAELCGILRKTKDADFRVPFQGAYSAHGEIVSHAAINTTRKQSARPSGPNIAIGRPARQSTTSFWSFDDDPVKDAAGANNGIVTGHFGFHTAIEDRPWWQVDLLQMSPISQIRIYNRLTCAERAANLQVFLSADEQNWQIAHSQNGIFGGADGNPLIVWLESPRLARFVRVQLPNKGVLHLDEIEVYSD
jgi:hypothetical protein